MSASVKFIQKYVLITAVFFYSVAFLANAGRLWFKLDSEIGELTSPLFLLLGSVMMLLFSLLMLKRLKRPSSQ